MPPIDYKHTVLGLIFLKYISDAFNELYERLATDSLSAPEDRDEYLAENVFWVPPEARWERLQGSAKSSEVGIFIDRAMEAIEKDNPSLKGVLPQSYGRETLDKRCLGELVDLIGTLGLGDRASRSKDVLGRVYDPCCDSGGMFVQPETFVQAHGGRLDDISIYGQESNPTTWRLCKMNLAIRGIEGNLGPYATELEEDSEPF